MNRQHLCLLVAIILPLAPGCARASTEAHGPPAEEPVEPGGTGTDDGSMPTTLPTPADDTAEGSADETDEGSADRSAEGSADEAGNPTEDLVTDWDRLLRHYTTEDGGFRYAALAGAAEDRAALDAFVDLIGATDFAALERDARLALLINAYNALTIRSVLELWPVESVLAEEGFFDARPHRVGGDELTLNQLENDRIRSFGEPRIHFVVNCASAGCPRLLARAPTAARLEEMLDEGSREFVRRTTVVDHESRSVSVSQIFEWFAGDFESSGGVRAFVASYLDARDAALVLDGSVSITHFEYDWSTNAR